MIAIRKLEILIVHLRFHGNLRYMTLPNITNVHTIKDRRKIPQKEGVEDESMTINHA